ncbi:hypothetical protein Tsubulata_027874, partial [Turnera subulata]
ISPKHHHFEFEAPYLYSILSFHLCSDLATTRFGLGAEEPWPAKLRRDLCPATRLTSFGVSVSGEDNIAATNGDNSEVDDGGIQWIESYSDTDELRSSLVFVVGCFLDSTVNCDGSVCSWYADPTSFGDAMQFAGCLLFRRCGFAFVFRLEEMRIGLMSRADWISGCWRSQGCS